MAQFNETWLKKVGLNSSSKQLHQLSDILEAVLETRVGHALSSHLRDAQIEEFEAILDRTDDNDADSERINWLEKNYPNYNRVVRYQKAKLSKQIRSSVNKAEFIERLGKIKVA